MDNRLKLEIATITIWHIGAIVISVIAFMILYMKANRTPSLKAFFYVQFTMILWMIGKIFKTISPTVDIRWSFIVLYYTAIFLLEVAFLEFGYAYYKEKPIKNKIKVLLYICPVIQFIIISTNPYHHLFYSSYNFYGNKFGILFYVHVVIEYLYILIGIIYCAKKFRKQFKDKDKWYKYLVVTGILAPIILNLIYVSRALHRFFIFIELPVIFDITPIVFTWSLLLFVYATFKYEFFNLSPIMKHEIINELDTPICILDSALDMVFINNKLEKTFNEDYYQIISKIIKSNNIIYTSKDGDFEKVVWHNNRCFLIFTKRIRTLMETQYMVTFNEITSYKQVETEFVKKKQELDDANRLLNETIKMLKETSRIGARNYVARELHDIIGHSLVVTIKLLEVSRLYHKRDDDMSIEALDEAIQSIDTGISDLKTINSKENKGNIYTGILLEKELKKILEHISSMHIKTNFYFKGKLHQLDEKTFDVIKKICTELITNSLKHSQANEILLSINIRNPKIDILIVDNGRGSKKIKKGNGLKGVDNRLSLVGGKVIHNTNLNEGFSSNISIPL